MNKYPYCQYDIPKFLKNNIPTGTKHHSNSSKGSGSTPRLIRCYRNPINTNALKRIKPPQVIIATRLTDHKRILGIN